jgi:hypothetical protein
MKTKHTLIKCITLLALLLLALNSSLLTAFAQGTVFTYQGRLNDGNNPANGVYDLRFAIYDARANGNQAGSAVTNFATGATNGLFTVALNFGGIFTGTNYWLDIGVRTNGAGMFAGLTPRQPVTPTPYAIFANSASNLLGTLPTAQLSGTLSASQLSGVAGAATNFTGNLNGDVTGTQSATVVSFVSGQSAANVAAGASAANAATNSATPNTIVKRDAAASFSATNLTLNGALNLPATMPRINSGAGLLLLLDAVTNFFVGPGAGNLAVVSTGNTGLGYQALHSDSSGSENTAVGYQAYYSGAGSFNTAVGNRAISLNGNGSENTAVGDGALYTGGGNYNTAVGTVALYTNSTGGNNTAVGDDALYANTSGGSNTGIGSGALIENTTGIGNTALGFVALEGNTNGNDNIAIGVHALDNNTRGSFNIAIGYQAGTAIIAGNNNIEIGNSGTSGDTNTIRIGTQNTQTNTFIAGIYGATAASGVQVFVNPSGQLGTLTSSERFKQNIRGMGDESDVLLALRPVAFQYKPDVDPQGLLQFGLIAEEVDKVAPGLVARDDKNQIYTVRYQAVDAMLLNEFLKQHQKITGQNEEIQTLKQQNDSLEKRLKELEATVKSLMKNK